MKTEIILFDNHCLYLEAMGCLLDKNGFGEKYSYTITTEADELENLIKEESQIINMPKNDFRP